MAAPSREARARLPGNSFLLMDESLTARRWPWFAAWAVPGACFVLSLSALALITFPLAILTVLVFRRYSRGRDRLGLFVGAGIAVAFFGSLHTNYRACSVAPHVGGTSYSCGGVDGPRWLIVGIAVTVASAAIYWYTERRADTNGSSSSAQASRDYVWFTVGARVRWFSAGFLLGSLRASRDEIVVSAVLRSATLRRNNVTSVCLRSLVVRAVIFFRTTDGSGDYVFVYPVPLRSRRVLSALEQLGWPIEHDT
jgi:hypothetical protein